MPERADITPALCRQLLRYDPETGKLYWLARGDPAWDAKWAGREAFTASKDGYRVGSIHGVAFRAHRVIWALVHGEWPPDQIDHDDGDRSNNRMSNLLASSNRQNHRNEAIPKNNTSGIAGVHYCKQTGKWRASIKVDYRTRCLGRHDTFAQAAAAREAGKRRYGFTERHGSAQ